MTNSLKEQWEKDKTTYGKEAYKFWEVRRVDGADVWKTLKPLEDIPCNMNRVIDSCFSNNMAVRRKEAEK